MQKTCFFYYSRGLLQGFQPFAMTGLLFLINISGQQD